MEFHKLFSQRLQELRRANDETPQQIAGGLWVLRPHYQKFESGENLPNIENFISLADHINVSTDYLGGPH